MTEDCEFCGGPAHRGNCPDCSPEGVEYERAGCGWLVGQVLFVLLCLLVGAGLPRRTLAGCWGMGRSREAE